MDGFAWTYLYLARDAEFESPSETEPALLTRPLAIALAPPLLFVLAFPPLAQAHGFRCPPPRMVRCCRPVAAAPVAPSGISTAALQRQLKALGYFPASVRATGYYGEITRNAVRAFQRDRGLLVDGIAGRRTIAALQGNAATPTVTAPASSPSTLSTVARQKQRLNQFGYSAGTGDEYDAQMELAVKRFQEDKGLPVTGQIGDRTQQILLAPENGLPTVEPGDASHIVQLVQERLGLLPTGAFDDETAQAVREFQEERGLKQTGVVGDATHRELKTWRGRLAVVNEILGNTLP